jgi:hypothetical protein
MSRKDKYRNRVKKNTKVEKLMEAAQDNAAKLSGLAATGREDAAVALYRVAALTTDLLTLLCRKNPAQFSAIAVNRFSWPVMYGPHRDWRKSADELIKKLKVGAKTNINLSSSGKTFRWDVPANVVAFNLHQLAQTLQRAPMHQWNLHDAFL